MKTESYIVIGGTLLWCAGIVAAPMLSGTLFSELLYRMYSVVCHQFDSRTFHLHGAPMAVCIRCSAIYGTFLVTLLALRSDTLRSKGPFGTKLLLGVTVIPMAVDGSLSMTGFYHASDLSRMVTGSLFGAGMALFLYRSLEGTVHSLLSKKRTLV